MEFRGDTATKKHLPVLIGGFLLVGGALVIGFLAYSFSNKGEPTPETQEIVVPISEAPQQQNQAPAPVSNTQNPYAGTPSYEVQDPVNKSYMIYTSSSFGLRFKYPKESPITHAPNQISETDNLISFDGTELDLFIKPADETLSDAVKKLINVNGGTNECAVVPFTLKQINADMVRLQNPIQTEKGQALVLCPDLYQKGFFLEHPQRKDTFYFYRITRLNPTPGAVSLSGLSWFPWYTEFIFGTEATPINTALPGKANTAAQVAGKGVVTHTNPSTVTTDPNDASVAIFTSYSHRIRFKYLYKNPLSGEPNKVIETADRITVGPEGAAYGIKASYIQFLSKNIGEKVKSAVVRTILKGTSVDQCSAKDISSLISYFSQSVQLTSSAPSGSVDPAEDNCPSPYGGFGKYFFGTTNSNEMLFITFSTEGTADIFDGEKTWQTTITRF